MGPERVGRVHDLHMGLIPSTLYGPLGMIVVILEHKARSKS